MTEFETLINPPQEVFEQLANSASLTEDWAFQMGDYKFWSTNYDKFWLISVVEKVTLNFVASVSLACWDDADDGPLYTVALFYCIPKYRGLGVGRAIFQKVIDMAGDNNLTLAGGVSMSDKYATVFGFDKLADHWHMFSSLDCNNTKFPDVVSKEYTTKVWTDVDHAALMSYDRSVCHRERKKLMTAWFNADNRFTRVVLDTSGNIVGYATVRPVTKNKLSCAPFYADTLDAAVVLLKEILEAIPDWSSRENLGFFYPQCNENVPRLLETFAKNRELIFTCTASRRQFTKKFISSAVEKTYAVSDGSFQFV